MVWKPLQCLADCIIHIGLPVNIYWMTITCPISFQLAVLPFENRRHSVEWRHHVLHMRSHPFRCNLNVRGGYSHYFERDGYDIRISIGKLAAKKLYATLKPLTLCLSGAWAMWILYGPRVTLNSSPSDKETSFSGCFIRRCTSFILPSVTIWGRYNSLLDIKKKD